MERFTETDYLVFW